MTIDDSVEIRKLPPSHITQLSSVLEIADQWKKLMSIVPSVLTKDNFECKISCENPAKYNSDHIRLIETASIKYKRTGTEILLEEWGCSGRIRPAVGHLRYLLIQAELFRAADYVAQNILHESPPERPSQGPAARIPTNINRDIMEQFLNEMNYESDLLENISPDSFNNNLDHSKPATTIPEIIVTPDVEDRPTSPNFNMQNTNEGNESKTVSSMIKFSSSIASTASLPNLSAFSDSDTVDESDTSIEIQSHTQDVPALSELLPSENNIPNITELNCASESSGIIPNLSGLNQISEKDIPQSELDQNIYQSASHDLIPNLSELNQPSTSIPNLTELISTNLENNSSSASTSNPTIIPVVSILTTLPGNEMGVNVSEENDSLPNLSVLIPETSRRSSLNVSINTFGSSVSRQCTSPLPNLTLNTHLPHFAYHELEVATNDFNEEPFEDLKEVGRFLGAGAFGKVFLATGLLDRPVAVKKLFLENVEVVNIDDTVTRQFRNEVEVLSRFQHENLLSLLGYSCDGCTYCLLYEYISGGTLKDRLQDGGPKLTWQERLDIALGTAKAVSYLHTAFSSPLIHRDIKTANILLDSSNKPKLGDFGITKLLTNQNTNTCTVIGTSAYMAPEALRGDISVKCDTFSFGVVLLELLTSLPSYDEKRDGNDLVTHVEENCEETIQPLLDITVGTWISNDLNFGEELYSIANQCLMEKKKRPVMARVTDMLNDLICKRH
ncbi:hypothetical protein HHI36_008714 [Cryptolaemus montrouzieri]|uniref:non-specific serine/threonine protein kinase n=1 Tax=Cryptolaemus montrouzieri TaxID=559131 RepID=A0ABD2MU62_9CUCU